MSKDWNDLVLDGLAALKRRDNWELGDTILRVCRAYGQPALETYADELRISMDRVKQYKVVAETFPPSEREHRLLWTHHYQARTLPNRRDWLERCVREGIDASRMRELIRQERDESPRQAEMQPLQSNNIQALYRTFYAAYAAVVRLEELVAWIEEHENSFWLNQDDKDILRAMTNSARQVLAQIVKEQT